MLDMPASIDEIPDRVEHAPRCSASLLSAALDLVAAPLFVVDRQASLLHVNQRGRDLIATAVVVTRRIGRLAAVDRHADRQLLNALAMGRGKRGGHAPVTLPLPTTHNGDAWLAHVSSQAALPRGRSEFGSEVAVVVVRPRRIGFAAALAAFTEAHGLTPAEARVLGAIIEVGRVPQAARALGISETTAKCHLQRIFGKTGTNRQADLVKLAAAFLNPLA
jgi:DNA-binding CsgD family transcriptional regulator